jgi:streptomycin 6-kinase
MITEPLGSHLDQSCPAACIIQVICDIAETIIANSEEDPPILHRDISAANIIMDSQKRGLLIDYQVAESFQAS